MQLVGPPLKICFLLLQDFNKFTKEMAVEMNEACKGKLEPPKQLKAYTEYLATYQMLDSDKEIEIPGQCQILASVWTLFTGLPGFIPKIVPVSYAILLFLPSATVS